MLEAVEMERLHPPSNNFQYNSLFQWSWPDGSPLYLASYFTLIFALILFFHFHNARRPTKLAPDITAPAKAPERPPGVWFPVDFKRPEACPYPNWDIKTTKPLPYRPFKWGPYNITMGLRTMRWDEWIELDNQFLTFHKCKTERIAERGARCCKTAPEAFYGACELLEELCVCSPAFTLHSIWRALF